MSKRDNIELIASGYENSCAGCIHSELNIDVKDRDEGMFCKHHKKEVNRYSICNKYIDLCKCNN